MGHGVMLTTSLQQGRVDCRGALGPGLGLGDMVTWAIPPSLLVASQTPWATGPLPSGPGARSDTMRLRTGQQ